MTLMPRKDHPGLPGQINPPFDASAPCAMCSNEVRGIWACTHNMLNRWREGQEWPDSKFWSKLNDLRRAAAAQDNDVSNPRRVPLAQLIESAHADVQPMLATTAALLACFKAALEFDPDAQPSQVAPALKPFVDSLRRQIRPVALLNEAHFDDTRHSHGLDNVLHEKRGFSDDRGGDYNWSVEVVDRGPSSAEIRDGDLRHRPCGTELAIAEHFKERIRFDAAWYGQAWCPVCKLNAPWAQFECRVTA